jgi:hypothetical protein
MKKVGFSGQTFFIYLSIRIFLRKFYSINIVSPNKFLLANPILLTGISEEALRTSKGDISWSWYIVGEGENGQFITIDLSPGRLGRCYDSFWDCHAMPGYSQRIDNHLPKYYCDYLQIKEGIGIVSKLSLNLMAMLMTKANNRNFFTCIPVTVLFIQALLRRKHRAAYLDEI